MKLIRFTNDHSKAASFGVVIRDHAVSLAVLQERSGKKSLELADSRSYLAHLPQS